MGAGYGRREKWNLGMLHGWNVTGNTRVQQYRALAQPQRIPPLKELDEENKRLKKMYAERSVDCH
jgi:hypothetical protein